MASSSGNSEEVSTICNLTGVTPEEAQFFLEASNGDVQQAASMCLGEQHDNLSLDLSLVIPTVPMKPGAFQASALAKQLPRCQRLATAVRQKL